MNEQANGRQCGVECLYPDDPHLEPIVYWIGDFPLAHGERDDEDAEHPEHCLCGHPNYLTCGGEGLMTMVVGDPYGGRISAPGGGTSATE